MISASNYPPRKVNLTSGPTEHVIRIRKENKDLIRITGKVVDAETKQPIEKFTVNNTQEYGNLSLSAEGRQGEFALEVRQSDFPQGYYPGFKLRLNADGYAPFLTEQMEFLEGDRTLEISLKKGTGGLAGTIHLPNGEPAADAKIFLTATDGSIYSHRPGEFTRHGTGVTGKTEADGRFSLAAAANEPKSVVVTHDEGFAALTFEQFRSSLDIKLQAWGSIEGTMRIGSKPGSQERVYLYTSGNWDRISSFSFIIRSKLTRTESLFSTRFHRAHVSSTDSRVVNDQDRASSAIRRPCW